MERVDSNADERSGVHPALMGFLYRGPVPEVVSNDARQMSQSLDLTLADDNPLKTPQTEGAFESGSSTMRVLLVSPPSPFATTVSEVLHRIDSECSVTHATQLSKHALRDGKDASLALIDLDGFEVDSDALIRDIRSRSPDAPVVALSSKLERRSIDCALDAGAVGYLPKNYAAALIEGVLRLVIGGEGYRPTDNNSATLGKRGRPKTAERQTLSTDNLAGLTPREKEVLVELAKGHTNHEIAKRLGMEEPTVKVHLHKIYRKLKVRNRAEAALSSVRVSEIQHMQIEEAERGKLNLSWLQPEMSHRRMRAGEWIFRVGDVGTELFYVQRGLVKLPEIGVTINQGEVFGEIGIFTPERKRTCSARCETEVDVFSLSSGQVRRIYFANPQFAFFIITLVATRLMADRQRTPT